MEEIKQYALFYLNEAMTERLPLTPLGKDLYRLEASSLSEAGVFYHDIIEAKFRFGKGLCFLRVWERSGLRVFRFLLPEKVVRSDLLAEFLRRVEAHGGFSEQIFGGILFVHLPRGSSCRPKSELREIFRVSNT